MEFVIWSSFFVGPVFLLMRRVEIIFIIPHWVRRRRGECSTE